MDTRRHHDGERKACMQKAAITDIFLHAVSHCSIRKGDEPPPARIYYGLLRTAFEPLSSLLYVFSPSPSAAPALFDVLYML